MIYTTRALLLNAEPLSEDGRLCAYLTEERGLITASVRGIRRMTAKQHDALIWFTPLHIRIGHQTHEGGRLLTAEADTCYEFSVEQRLMGMAMVDVLRAFGPEPERRRELFSLGLTAFERMRDRGAEALTQLIASALTVSGYATDIQDHGPLHTHARSIVERNLFCPLRECNANVG